MKEQKFMKYFKSIAITSILCICMFCSSLCIFAEDQIITENPTIIELADQVKMHTDTSVLDVRNKNVTSTFLLWYDNNKSEQEILEYMDMNHYSFYTLINRKNTSSLARSFESKYASQVFVDSFVANLIDNQPCTVRYTTTVSGNISYNANTYSVVQIYGTKVFTAYSGNYPLFVNFYADGYSISTSISSDKSAAYVTGYSSLYATLYPDNPIVATTMMLRRVSHTLEISV